MNIIKKEVAARWLIDMGGDPPAQTEMVESHDYDRLVERVERLERALGQIAYGRTFTGMPADGISIARQALQD